MNQYNLVVAAKDASAAANFQINLTAGELSQGNIGITSSNGANFSFANNAVAVQTETGGTTGMGLWLTAAGSVAGEINVIPAVDVPVELTLKDNGGKEIGTYTLKAGQTNGSFSWQLP